MSRGERTGKRDLTLSKFHRTLSDRCGMIDIDIAEYCDPHYGGCGAVIMLVESTREQGFKGTAVITWLANKADIPAYLIRYKFNACTPPPADDLFAWSCDPNRCGEHVIAECRVQRLPDGKVHIFTLEETAAWFESMHDWHEVSSCAKRQSVA